MVFNLIEEKRFVSASFMLPRCQANYFKPDIKKIQIQLTGFLDKDTASFCKELWKLCLSAQSSPQGVPKELLEAKKLEIIQEKVIPDYTVLQKHKAETKPRLNPRNSQNKLESVVMTNRLASATSML
jgi:hypothetical protein